MYKMLKRVQFESDAKIAKAPAPEYLDIMTKMPIPYYVYVCVYTRSGSALTLA